MALGGILEPDLIKLKLDAKIKLLKLDAKILIIIDFVYYCSTLSLICLIKKNHIDSELTF